MLPHADIHKIDRIERQHHNALEAVQLLLRPGERPHQYAHHNQNHNIDHIFHDKCDRTDRCCDTEHKQNIENIGADHITERHIQFIFARCNH